MVETIFFSKTKRVIPREEARWEYQEGKKQANLPKPKPQGITTFFNPLSPNIHIQILQTDLYTFPS